ncbi:nitroreductase family protein [Candidatus Woesearchaeota archaeon]|nr:MAG: nitroreductase family protein [Candidatus Woesearchaeota archaeon]
MDVFECIKSRRSIRKFLDTPVEWEKINHVLEAGTFAPSSGNLQNWRFIITTDEDQKKELSEACFDQYWIASAPVLITVVSESEKVERFYGIRGERLYAVQNCAAAIQNMLLAANALGLGSCWVGAFDEIKVARVLKIPDSVRPQAILPLGYPDERVPTPNRYQLADKVFIEEYGNKIKDLSAFINDYSVVWQREAKKKVKEIKKLKDKIKENFSKKQ